MDIFICNLSFSATESEIIEYFAELLHDGEFGERWRGAPTNFKVTLHRDKKGRGYRHGGSGILTLPLKALGEDFLDWYTGPLPRLIDKRVRIEPSTKPVSRLAIEPLLNTPYQDPSVLRAREELEDALSEVVEVSRLQFGWMDRDGVFSNEWGRSYGTEDDLFEAEIGFNAEKREMFIEERSNEPFLPEARRIVNMKIASVERIEKDPSGFFVILVLYNAPSFEQKPGLELLVLPFTRDEQRRTRCSSLDDRHHQELVAYTSLALRVQFATREGGQAFFDMSTAARLPNANNILSPPERRNHFSPTYLHSVDRWIARLEWSVAFQCAALLASHYVSAKELCIICRPDIEDAIRAKGSSFTADVVSRFALSFHGGARSRKDRIYVPKQDIEAFLRRQFADARDFVSKATNLNPADLSDGLFQCYHVSVTPTAVIPAGPSPEQSNRVLRLYRDHQDCFLRVNFVDEDGLRFRFDRDVDGPAFIKDCIGASLKRPLMIAGRAFEFLAYSMSALKEHAVWFVTPFVHARLGVMSAETIRSKLGNFDNVSHCPARYAARISQAFSATDPSITLEAEEIIHIDDIEGRWVGGQRVNFTDGIGLMSRVIAERIGAALVERQSKKRRNRHRYDIEHSAFQVRIGGSKGMLSVDHRRMDSAICLRPSMIKFQAPDSMEIEVAKTFERPGKMFLNRPLIMVLETLGVPIQVFRTLQTAIVGDIKIATFETKSSAKLLETYGLGTAFRVPSVLHHLKKLGMDAPPPDAFFDRGIHYAANDALRGLKHKARIPVPSSYTLVGVADTYNILKEGEIFVYLQDRFHMPRYLQGSALVTRSPTVHPGDVQLVTVIGRPPDGFELTLGKLTNCVVFAAQGMRSLPQSLGGGDLDGDLYNVIMYDGLLPPPYRIETPGSYPRTPLKVLPNGRTCSIEDIADFVVDYIKNDNLGLIAHQSLLIADQSEYMSLDKDCIRLAEMASQAVDFAKSGYPADLTEMPRLKFNQRPDWSAGETARPNEGNYYKSTRALGVLYRLIDLPATHLARLPKVEDDVEGILSDVLNGLNLTNVNDRRHTSDAISAFIRPQLQQHIPLDLDAEMTDGTILPQFRAYATKLQIICANCSLAPRRPLSEEECWAGTIVARSSQPRARQDMQARMRMQCDALVGVTRAHLDGNEDEPFEESLMRGWAAWVVSRSLGDAFGARTYGYIALGSIFESLRQLEQQDERLSW